MSCDTHAMVVVHRVFTREFRLLGEIAAATPPSDADQIRRVVRHGREMLTALHHHHHSEDELVWPRLRSAGLEAALIDSMESQHAAISAAMDALDAALTAWESDPTAADQVTLTAARLHPILAEHLADEENTVLPLVAETLTESQWAELGERGMASLPKRRALVFLGHILEDADDLERQNFLREIPAPVRALYRFLGAPAHARETRLLRRDLDPSLTERATS
ncbi:hemerythrin domain-containing protein [Nocardia sp. CDC160]|uniref:hemerythrin domain-containing protein n=1 Tax=Nocardia sp. CDC160 TaxID=3112166 RepID=UPI002DBA9A79|nr:hemerythrin domain-containing protein [Nocardia sp. CDC160]MEC3916376.1 hemerythrin domain-containing protein [Nocardia sp. CDC160]